MNSITKSYSTGLTRKSAFLAASFWCFLQPYYMAALDVTVDQRVMPLGYTFLGHEPAPGIVCDKPDCDVVGHEESHRKNCGHTFHGCCSPRDEACPVCQPLLAAQLRTLASRFNKALLSQEDDNPNLEDDADGDHDSDDDDDGDGDDPGDECPRPDDAQLNSFRRRLVSGALHSELSQKLRQSACTAPALTPACANRTAAGLQPPPPPEEAAAPEVNVDCPSCGKSYKTVRGLRQHQSRSHKKTTENN